MHTVIHTPTPNFAESKIFYEKLGFSQISDQGQSIFADQQCLIEVNADRFARPGVKLLQANWNEEVKSLNGVTEVIKIDSGYLLADPGGTWIYLVEGNGSLNKLTLPERKTILGNFAGLSLEVIDIRKAVTIWEILGFNEKSGNLDQGWITLRNAEGFMISLMKPMACPHLFFNPSLTYFNGGQNLPVIAAIRQEGIPITEEITHFNKDGIVDNVIIRDPGGYGFFIFND